MNSKTEQLIQGIKELGPQELRSDTETNYEFVISREKLEKGLSVLLEGYFGSPLKAAGKEVSPEAKKKAEPFGGVRKDQTLYSFENPEGYNTCMIWPWSDGRTVTVKMYRLAS